MTRLSDLIEFLVSFAQPQVRNTQYVVSVLAYSTFSREKYLVIRTEMRYLFVLPEFQRIIKLASRETRGFEYSTMTATPLSNIIHIYPMKTLIVTRKISVVVL
jgi:hypothetical protein